MDRRSFIKGAAVTASVAAMAPMSLKAVPEPGKKYISDKVILGDTGIQVSRMAMGTGTNGWAQNSNQTRQLGVSGVADLLQAAYDRGVIFWDSADQYGSHPHLKEALKRVPREKVVILSKTHASTEEEMKADLDRFRKELGTDYIDILLLHCMVNKDWPKEKAGAMEVLEQARQKKIIKAHGVSCHTLEALKTAAETPWVQIDLARINPAGVSMDDKVPTVVPILKQMKQSGKVIMGMKIFGVGKLIDRKDECIKYALAQDYMSCFTIGIESLDQFLDLEKRFPELS
ncbi:MAG TPA: aldo/keto reductase [Bacteroidales bacterium]|nr:aldo/keto reductase [Bacteroidales bacterium]